MGTKLKRQTHTDVALFALWLEKNSQEFRNSPRTAEAIQRMYHSAKQPDAGHVGLPAIKKLSKALEVPLAKMPRARGEHKTSKRTDRIIMEMKDLSEKLQVLAKHVLTLTDDEYLVDGSNVDQFEITAGLKALVDKQAAPASSVQEQESTLPANTTVPKWGKDDQERPQA